MGEIAGQILPVGMSAWANKTAPAAGTNGLISGEDLNVSSAEVVIFYPSAMNSNASFTVTAMSSGREAAERVHEYIMNLENNHVSFYERYYKQNLYDRMLEGGKTGPPPE